MTAEKPSIFIFELLELWSFLSHLQNWNAATVIEKTNIEIQQINDKVNFIKMVVAEWGRGGSHALDFKVAARCEPRRGLETRKW